MSRLWRTYIYMESSAVFCWAKSAVENETLWSEHYYLKSNIVNIVSFLLLMLHAKKQLQKLRAPVSNRERFNLIGQVMKGSPLRCQFCTTTAACEPGLYEVWLLYVICDSKTKTSNLVKLIFCSSNKKVPFCVCNDFKQNQIIFFQSLGHAKVIMRC